MTRRAIDDVLAYYREELDFLHRSGADFARRFPKVAPHLELGPHGSADPHVERLLEGVAFLTARVRRRLDDDFSEVSGALLDVLHPYFLQPVPAMAIAQLSPLPAAVPGGYTVPRHTPLFARADEELACRFRTCYPVTRWPLEVTEATLERADAYPRLLAHDDAVAVLRIRVALTAGRFADLQLDRLRLYLHGDGPTTAALHELLFCDALGVLVRADDEETPAALAASALRPVGFGPDEDVIPAPADAPRAYRLLREYFAFAPKFLFVDVAGLDVGRATRHVDVLVRLGRHPHERLVVDRDTFRLGCTPIVNLFRRTAEPVRVDHRRSEYHLVGDARRERACEIHSVERVRQVEPNGASRTLPPLFGLTHADASGDGAPAVYWHARRESSLRRDVHGTETFLSFHDAGRWPTTPATAAVLADVLCTNRRLAVHLPTDALLEAEAEIGGGDVALLTRPTTPVDPELDGATQWKLVSQLALNHLSLGGPRALETLREIIKLHGDADPTSADRHAAGVRAVSTRPIVRRRPGDAWRGLCHGTEVTIAFDDEHATGAHPFLFMMVLDHFVALHAAVNHVTELNTTSTRRHGAWRRFPARVGEEPLL